MFRNSIGEKVLLFSLCFVFTSKASVCQTIFKRHIISSSKTIIDTLVNTGNGKYRKAQWVRPDIFIDSFISVGNDYEIDHYHYVSKGVQEKIVYDTTDNVFNDSLNNYSRLIFNDYSNSSVRKQFNIPTIPLTNITYLKKLGIIIGLTQLKISPYQIVIYSTEGKLLSKRSISGLVFKFSKQELKDLLKTYPQLRGCLTNSIIVKNEDSYLFDMNHCFLYKLRKDSIAIDKNLFTNPDFPGMTNVVTESWLFNKYMFFVSESTPFNDLTMIGSVPYLLILNSEDGRKVNIPLVSNCDIDKELQ